MVVFVDIFEIGLALLGGIVEFRVEVFRSRFLDPWTLVKPLCGDCAVCGLGC